METPDPDPSAGILPLLQLLSFTFHGFDLQAFGTLLVLLVLLAFSGLVSASETAFFSLKPLDLNFLKNQESKTSALILQLREDHKHLLATILILNNLINVAIVIVSAYFMSALFDFGTNAVLQFVVQVVITTSIILMFGEIVPKIYANLVPLRVAGLMARPMRAFITLLRPLSLLLVNTTGIIDKRLVQKHMQINMSELSAAIDITTDESTPPEEKKMLKGIATFGEKDARSIMKSRMEITAVEVNTPFEELIALILKSGYSRIPVYEESLDNVRGILYIKDLLPYLGHNTIAWETLIRPAFFVPESKRINDLMQEFREKKIHLAIVVDEYGGTAGLLTLEDIIEEIVGDISDEFDKEPEHSLFRKTDTDTWLFEGRVSLLDFCKVMEIDSHYFEDVQGDSDTLAGLILELQGLIPAPGTSINCKDFTFEVMEADNRRIKQIKVKSRNVQA
ncbi:MAG TPA: gliding motility-associated protein GldE [Bacteroidales bacterium]|nr:gliding motility-associated protein GldE [Bacteroidales bacterium]